MPVPASSLSVAIQGVADFLASQFTEEVVVSVAHPQRAAEMAKGSNASAHCLNVFAYRVAPSGFHAGEGAGDTQFIRVNALITPFPFEGETTADDADLRILGHVIRVLQSNPVLPITGDPLPGAALPTPPTPKPYRLQAVMQAPGMEELNYIWSTQGGELAYRLSAAYEFSLIPIEPIEPRIIAAPPTTVLLDARVGGSGVGFTPISADTRSIPLTGADGVPPPPAPWVPVQMLVVSTGLASAGTVPAAETGLDVAVVGPPGEAASVEIEWTLADASVTADAPRIVPIGAPVLDAPEAVATLTIAVPATAASAVVRARAASGGAPVPNAPFGNALTLTVTP